MVLEGAGGETGRGGLPLVLLKVGEITMLGTGVGEGVTAADGVLGGEELTVVLLVG